MDPQKYPDFAKRVRELREKRGFSKAYFARQLDVSNTCVGHWEEGNTFPRPETLGKICMVLETTQTFLKGLGDDDQVSPAIRCNKTGVASHQRIAELALYARKQIAEAAGIELDQVRITLEY
jgi:transcriptional regulator with XRE-family HTH domain